MPLFLGMMGMGGPPDMMFGAWTHYLWILPLAVVPIIVLVLYWLLFPSLVRVKVTKDVKSSSTEYGTEEGPKKDIVVEASQARVEAGAIDKARVEAALRVLGEDERRVVQVLMEAGGRMLQKEISWKTGFSRVKTHRVLVRLLRRGLVSAEKYYNTNRITLADWLLKGRPTDKEAAGPVPH